MIGKLYGVIDELELTYALIRMTDGVCYKVFLPAHSLKTLTKDAPAAIYTYHHVRENEVNLFGFLTKDELMAFTILISISGVGPKTAQTILGYGELSKLVAAVKTQDVEYFSHIPGIGKKTAQKILLELSSKFNTEFQMPKVSFTEDEKTLLDALLSLGFKRNEALPIIDKVSTKGTLEQRITESLQLLDRKS